MTLSDFDMMQNFGKMASEPEKWFVKLPVLILALLWLPSFQVIVWTLQKDLLIRDKTTPTLTNIVWGSLTVRHVKSFEKADLCVEKLKIDE